MDSSLPGFLLFFTGPDLLLNSRALIWTLRELLFSNYTFFKTLKSAELNLLTNSSEPMVGTQQSIMELEWISLRN